MTAGAVALLAALSARRQTSQCRRRPTGQLKLANRDLAIANGRVTKANDDLKSANQREQQRFELAMEAIKLFHGEVSEDVLLKEKQFEKLRGKLLRGAAAFYGKLEGLLKGQTDPKMTWRSCTTTSPMRSIEQANSERLCHRFIGPWPSGKRRPTTTPRSRRSRTTWLSVSMASQTC